MPLSGFVPLKPLDQGRIGGPHLLADVILVGKRGDPVQRPRVQRMQHLLRLAINLSMQSVAFGCCLRDKLGAHRHSLAGGLHAGEILIDLRQFCLQVNAVIFGFDSAVHNVFDGVRHLVDLFGLVVQVGGDSVEVPAHRVGGLAFHSQIGDDSAVVVGDRAQQGRDRLELPERILDRGRGPRLDPVQPIDVRRGHGYFPPHLERASKIVRVWS